MSDPLNADEADDEAFVEQQLMVAIENQLAAGEPACTQAVYNKLTLVGFERAEILDLMAQVLANEIHTLMQEDRGFDGARYEQLLRRLPELPES